METRIEARMSYLLAKIFFLLACVFIGASYWPVRVKSNQKVPGVLKAPSPDCDRRYVP